MIDKEKYIYHHLGLGDHIICNAIVRHYKKSYEKLYVFCKPHNFENVSYMYKDDKNIIILPIGEDNDVNIYISKNNLEDKVIRIGFEYVSRCNLSSFDECFYTSIGLNFDDRFTGFLFVRDIEKEKEIYNKLNPQNHPYIFTHGGIDKSKIRQDLKIIENPLEYNIFDLLYLVENADEVHLMESSIKCLVNSYKMTKPKFFYHRYVRGYGDFLNSKGLNEYVIIN